MKSRVYSWFVAALFLAAGALHAADHPVKADLLSETDSFVPGQALTVALRLEHEEGWHTYWKDPGDAGLPTSIEWDLPAGVKAGPLLWPQPLTFEDPGNIVGYGYGGTALLLAEISVSKTFSEATLPLKGKAFWLVCREVCIPGDAALSLSLPKGDGSPGENASLIAAQRPLLGLDPAPPQAHPREGALSLGLAFLFALIGGLLLNLMPCVLPVLSLKVLSFVEHAKESRAKGLELAAWFAGGVLVSFWALAAAVLAFKAAGQEVGWGFQFQSPGFVLFMSAVVLAFALNLFGVFEIQLPGSAVKGLHAASSGHGRAGAFSHGLFMTLLATPCTAPFLGTALGFAFAQPGPVLVLIFTGVALGLALPYVLLAAWPRARAWVPKPGPWMLRFKEAMGFLLLATLIWLMWVLAKQVGSDSALAAWAWLLLLALALWVAGFAASPVTPTAQRWAVRLFLAAALAAGGVALLKGKLEPATGQASVDAGWLAWDPAEIEKLRDRGMTIFVDFTADWCWTCKVNEKAVLQNDKVARALEAENVVKMKADWTRRDAAIGAALKGFGRSGVPLYVVYRGKEKPQVLPEVITSSMVLEALRGGGG